jgi:hypothetical protein
MTRLNGDLEALLLKKAEEDNVVQVQLDGGQSW